MKEPVGEGGIGSCAHGAPIEENDFSPFSMGSDRGGHTREAAPYDDYRFPHDYLRSARGENLSHRRFPFGENGIFNRPISRLDNLDISRVSPKILPVQMIESHYD